MFAKLFQKAAQPHQDDVPKGSVTLADLDLRVAVHYGIPSTASILGFDPIQRLLAVGTLDGRIKVIGGDNIEGLLVSPKPLPFKNLEFIQNQGLLVSVSNENEIQVWDLEHRCIASNLQWESNITAFSVIFGTQYMYIGDEFGFVSVLKFDFQEGKLLYMPYNIPANIITDATGISLSTQESVVGVLSQPCSSGNRVLIAYENGLIILWDVTEDRAVLVRGYKDLQLKDERVVDPLSEVSHQNLTDGSDHEQAEKEISSLCWASNDGSILAVGYVDGDILLWNLLTAVPTKNQQALKSSNNDVVKVQLSSGDRRLPVIVLHWYASRGCNDQGGHLFVYGGDDIGSEEVLTILSLDWSSGMETLKCVGRVDLTLNGSFADMILVPNAGATESRDTTSLFVLNNPGQLNFYDDACLSALISHQEKKHIVPAVQYPGVIPTVEPYMTISKLSSVHIYGSSSRALAETASAAKLQAADTTTAWSTNWPLTGGVPSQLSCCEDRRIERIYIAGYQDGSVRIWDATFPVLSPIFVLGSESIERALSEKQVEGIEFNGVSASISAVDFCSVTCILAVGNERGLVRLYRLIGNSEDMNLHFVTEARHEVHNLLHGNGAQCTAVFCLLNSLVSTLKLISSGVRLAVGFECGRVAMLDTGLLSVLFITDFVSSPSSPAVSLAMKTFPNSYDIETSNLGDETNDSMREVVFILTRNAHVVLVDGITGNMISSQLMHQESTAMSIYMLDENTSVPEESGRKHSLILSQDHEARNEHGQTCSHTNNESVGTEFDGSTQDSDSDSVVLFCCEDALHLYSSKSLILGNINSIRKVNLLKPCFWASVFKKDGKTCGLIVIYQSGLIEIRSFPDLEVVGETSLMSILRWNSKPNMSKTMSSSSTGQIALVNGSEIAFVSLLAFENDFRIPEALPSLHDKVLEAAADAAFSFSQSQKKKQIADNASGIFSGILKGLKRGKADQCGNLTEAHKTPAEHFEGIFSRFPFSASSISIEDDQDVVETNIDDIEIDEPEPEPVPVPSSSHSSKNDKQDKGTEREKLFEGGTTDTKPKLRTPQEIMAKYRSAEDANAAAARARDRLIERQEKLEKLSMRTGELQNEAENFAAMASELAKTMKNRKWWNI